MVKIVGKDKNLRDDIRIYSVDEITIHIKDLIWSDKVLQDVWVKGEISNFKHHNNTHMYFSLKDENSIIECVMFQSINQNLEFTPENGIKVIVRGHIDIFKPRGKYEIIVKEIHLEGKGELYIKFLQLKARLEKEGLFKEEHKKPIPKYPKVVGIVTSLQGAVIYDIIKIVRIKYPHIRILIYPSFVQGDQAKYTIIKGIETLNNLTVDVIIIARGGGSFEELWPFNEEIVARAIYNSKIPVISAVGHELDFTIADFTADKRAPTPSAAAEMAVPNEEEILGSFKNLEKRLYKEAWNILEIKKQTITYIVNRPLFKRPYILINEYKQILDEKTIQIRQLIKGKIDIFKRDMGGVDGRLKALSPYAVLNRGYSITKIKGKVVSSIKNINEGDIISTIVRDGKINSEVKDKDERKIL